MMKATRRSGLSIHLASIIILAIMILASVQAGVDGLDDDGFCPAVRSGERHHHPSPSVSAGCPSSKPASFLAKYEEASRSFQPCPALQQDVGDLLYCRYAEVIKEDMEELDKISKALLDKARSAVTNAVTYQIIGGKLWRSQHCLFPSRCQGIQYFLLKLLADRPAEIPDLEMVVNTYDWPHIERHHFKEPLPVFSFSKTKHYYDLFYPAWTFWSGGPAISHYPAGIGRWDLMRDKLKKAAMETPWGQKADLAFFRGSRTSDDRDALILLSREQPQLVDAKYTKNQSWRSKADTLGQDPAPEVTMEEHCRYKYLFNFRGVAASFRLKHLFMCGSTVVHVGSEWDEFFYTALVPWYHYVPISSADALKKDKLVEVVDFLRANPAISQTIAENGRRFVADHLRMEDVEQYWRSLLITYAKKLAFQPKPNPEYISIIKNY